ncbi:MAG: heme ABC exporter ATP-binding protein CcmA [Rhodobacteraceae bacterium]|nr:heme ABC exporter ATP-binding protein CcmA [Paracoccaceae bacterium]
MRLDVSDLACQRSGRPVLEGVSFTLEGGEALGLRGPNGSGKSTLLRVLAGLLPRSRGAVTLDGIPLGRDHDAYAERIAYAGHLDAIKPQLTVAENLAFWGALFGSPDIAPALAAFDLGAIAARPAHACSAGQKRRLGLARLALAPNRPLWLLDEPTVSLDGPACALLFSAIRAHCARGGAAIIATHVPLDVGSARDLTLAPVVAASPGIAGYHDPFLEGLAP